MMVSNVSEASLGRVRLNHCGNKRGHVDHKKENNGKNGEGQKVSVSH